MITPPPNHALQIHTNLDFAGCYLQQRTLLRIRDAWTSSSKHHGFGLSARFFFLSLGRAPGGGGGGYV